MFLQNLGSSPQEPYVKIFEPRVNTESMSSEAASVLGQVLAAALPDKIWSEKYEAVYNIYARASDLQQNAAKLVSPATLKEYGGQLEDFFKKMEKTIRDINMDIYSGSDNLDMAALSAPVSIGALGESAALFANGEPAQGAMAGVTGALMSLMGTITATEIISMKNKINQAYRELENNDFDEFHRLLAIFGDCETAEMFEDAGGE